MTEAISPGEVEDILLSLGFKNIRIQEKERSDEIIRRGNVPEGGEKVVFSPHILAVKPLAPEGKTL